MATQNSFCPMPVGSCSYLLQQLNVWDVFSEKYFPASFYWTIYNTLSRGNQQNPYTFITIASNCDMRKEVIRISYKGVLPPSDLNNGILPLIYERGFGGGAHTWRAYDNIFGGSEQVMFPCGDNSIIPSPGCDAGMNDCITDGGIDGFPHVKAVSVPADQDAAWIQDDCANVTLNVPRGEDGNPGTAATIQIVETDTLPAGSAAAMVETADSTPQNRKYKAEIPGSVTGAMTEVSIDNSGDVQFSGDGNKVPLKGTVPALTEMNTAITTAQKTADTAQTTAESASSAAQLAQNTATAAKTQTDKLKALAFKDKAEVSDIDASGTASATTYLRGDGAWAAPTGTEDDVARAAAKAAQQTADNNTTAIAKKMNIAGDNANIPMDGGTTKWGALVGATSTGLKSVPLKNIVADISGNILKAGAGLSVSPSDIPPDASKLNATGDNPNFAALPSGLANYGIPVYNSAGKLAKSNIDQIIFSAKLTNSVSALFQSPSQGNPGLVTGNDGGMSVNVDNQTIEINNINQLAVKGGGSGGGLQKVSHDNTLQNDGTDSSKLGINFIANQAVSGIVGCLFGAPNAQGLHLHSPNDFVDNHPYDGTIQGLTTQQTITGGFAVPLDSSQFKINDSSGHPVIQLVNGGGGGGGLQKVAHDSTMVGDGTDASNLKVNVSPLTTNQLQSTPSGLYVAAPNIISFVISPN